MWDEWCCRIVRSGGMSSDLWDLLLLLHLTAPILSHSLICLSRISSPVIFCSDLISTTALFHYSPSIPSSFQFHFHLRSRFLANSSWILCCLSTIVRVTCLYFCTSPQSVDHSIPFHFFLWFRIPGPFIPSFPFCPFADRNSSHAHFLRQSIDNQLVCESNSRKQNSLASSHTSVSHSVIPLFTPKNFYSWEQYSFLIMVSHFDHV